MNNNKCAIITGASDGIGKSVAFEMANRGYSLGLIARRIDKLKDIKTQIHKQHPDLKIELEALDVTHYDEIDGCLTELVSKLGKLDILIVNAGVARAGKVDRMSLEDQLLCVNTNLNGAIATISSGVRLFKQQGYGHIVATSSVAGYRGLPRNAAYSASKAGLTNYLEAVQVETLKDNIDVSIINPGFIDTALNKSVPNRPFVIPVEQGAKLYVDLIEKKVKSAEIPKLPWTILGPIMRILPNSIISKM